MHNDFPDHIIFAKEKHHIKMKWGRVRDKSENNKCKAKLSALRVYLRTSIIQLNKQHNSNRNNNNKAMNGIRNATNSYDVITSNQTVK